MSIKRYLAWPGSSLAPHDDGLWVRYEDHAAKVEKLKKAVHLALWAHNLRERGARNSALREARAALEEA
jgi:hypothetical protein